MQAGPHVWFRSGCLRGKSMLFSVSVHAQYAFPYYAKKTHVLVYAICASTRTQIVGDKPLRKIYILVSVLDHYSYAALFVHVCARICSGHPSCCFSFLHPSWDHFYCKAVRLEPVHAKWYVSKLFDCQLTSNDDRVLSFFLWTTQCRSLPNALPF
jgi:hypothetical protein